ncbi:AraC family transcriptional regulator [Microvirga sp. P5_D2]
MARADLIHLDGAGFSPKPPPRTPSTEVIRVGVTKEIVPLLREFGADPDEVIRESGLDPALFADENNHLPYSTLGRLLVCCVARTRCPHFGLLVGQRATTDSLGLVGRLMRHAETMGDALRALVSYLGTQSRGAMPSLTVEDNAAEFSYLIYEPSLQGADQIADGVIACMVNTIRALCGSGWTPTEVLLPRAAPADRELYRRHFRAPVRFDQEAACIVFPVRDLELRITGADPLLRAILEEHLAPLTSAPSWELADDIRRMLRTRLASTPCSADRFAESLAMHRRTLSRRLSREGAGFRALTNEVRFAAACQLLSDTRIPLGQIAAALGYPEASAFTRAFRRWSGQTPTAWRAGCRPGGRALAA